MKEKLAKYIAAVFLAGAVTLTGCQSQQNADTSSASSQPETQESAPAEHTTAQTDSSQPADTTTSQDETEPPEVTEPYTSESPMTQLEIDVPLPEPIELPDENEQPPFTADMVLLSVRPDDKEITTEFESITLVYNFMIFDEEVSYEYEFGCEYSLEKKDENGEWQTVPFSEEAAWNTLAYVIGNRNDIRSTSTTVSLADDFYAEPLTAGEYRVAKPMPDDVVLYDEFTMYDYSKYDRSEYEVESASGTYQLNIDEIQDDRYICSMIWPYPAVYEVMCDTASYGYCVNDHIEVQYEPMYRIEEYRFRLIPVSIVPSDFELDPDVVYKPVIYLYPELPMPISVKLDFNGELTLTEPQYKDGWTVKAMPNGKLEAADGTQYSYLFWEGEPSYKLEYTDGFCVAGSDTAAFLSEKLAYLGLEQNEIRDLLEFWLPHMEGNTYNVIRFHSEDYTSNAPLAVSPAPDTAIRVYMSFAPSDVYVELNEQHLEKAPERSGFTLIEWGGSITSLDSVRSAIKAD